MLFSVEFDFSTDMTVAPVVASDGRYQEVDREMLELGHAQVGDGDEVLGVSRKPRAADFVCCNSLFIVST